MRYLLTITLSLALLGQTKRVDDALLRNAAKSASDGDWLSYGLTPGETRYSPLKQIDASNVKRLGLAWSYEVGDGGGDQEATPLVWNGTIFGVTNWSVVFAVDARTGKEKWRWDPEVNRERPATKICCGVVNRGIALYHGKIIAPVIDGRLQALDAETGKPVWEARVAYPQDDQTLTMAPRIAKGKVIVGVSGGDRPDARLLRRLRRGDRAARPGSSTPFPAIPPSPLRSAAMRKAAATWDGEWWKLGGGGAVWDGMAYDPEADLVYVGTGNAEPWPQRFAPKTRARATTTSMSARSSRCNVDTGELKWHYQMVPGDAWDFDSVQQMILADLTINGTTAQSDHAGQQERVLLCARPHHRRVHLRAAVLAGHLGKRDRSEDRPADHQS